MSVQDCAEAAEWDDFVAGHHNATIYHTIAWQDIIRDAFGKDTIRLCARNSAGKIAGILPLVVQKNILLGKNVLSMPYANYGGVLADSEGAAAELTARAARVVSEMDCKSLELRDFVVRSYQGYQERSDKVMMRLALPDSIEELERSIGAKVRSQIRRPQKEKATVEQGGAELVDAFYEVFCRNMRDLGTPVYAKQFFLKILEHIGGECRLIVVRMDDKPVAACFLIGYRDVLEIPWAASRRDMNRFGVNMLLYWEALKHAYEQGYRIFDFGRSTKEGGTFRFKKQWGAEPHPLTWHRFEPGADYTESGGTGMAERAVAIWKHLPLPVANWLGPRISPDLPW